jgi:hypothetical protein
MQRSIRWRCFELSIFTAAICAIAPVALAHTTVRSQATEGVRADNALKIGHGCDENPVIAQSVVFPTDAPLITTNAPGVVIGDLAEVIAQGGIAGLVGSIQDSSIFGIQNAKLDANENTIGFHGKQGLLRIHLRGRVPFEFTAPNFVPESCATALRVEIAIADICKLKAPTLQPGKVNLWIPDNGSQFAIQGAANGVEGIGGPARLTVNRDLANNPLPDACRAGYVVTLTPSAAQVDRDLPIGRYWLLR